MANNLLPLVQVASEDDPIKRAFLIEEGLQIVFKTAYETLKRNNSLSLGMDDFIMSMANNHESFQYLLMQRLR